MQTILGAGGGIGRLLAKDLRNYTSQVRLVSRKPRKISEDDEVIAADLNNREQVSEAVRGSEVVYLLAGLLYKTKVWEEQWPRIMENAIAACETHRAKLVFFDNVYLYDPAQLDNMTEETRIQPSSNKGRVREKIAGMLMDAVRNGRIEAMIVRAADFYGPALQNSMLIETTYKNFKKGKKAYWLGNPSKVHSFTYVPDASRATALLGNTADAFNQVWHLPTDPARITGVQMMQLFADAAGVKLRYSKFSSGIIRLLGLFNPLMKELYEMMYQFEKDYYFNSGKFFRRFPDFAFTSYERGVRQVVEMDKKKTPEGA
ncbi:MAG TPA: NAD-dependent epimerase/dehydratase family protein [Flavisolibacter sp.]